MSMDGATPSGGMSRRKDLFLSLLLGAQGALFIYTSDRIAGSMPATSPRRLAVLVASDLTAALDTDPAMDVEGYVRDQYSRVFQPFIVLMRDGREVSNPPAFIPDEVRNALRREMCMALVLSSHDLGVVAETCDRVALMSAGRIVE